MEFKKKKFSAELTQVVAFREWMWKSCGGLDRRLEVRKSEVVLALMLFSWSRLFWNILLRFNWGKFVFVVVEDTICPFLDG